jgi:predicted lipoprotein with Yx(FWY)xxD motif
MKTSRLAAMALAIGAALLITVGAQATAAYASNGPGGFGPGFGHKGSHERGGPGSDRGAAVVSLESSPSGQALVVGGAGAGYVPADPTTNPPTPASYNYPAGSSLYFASIDPPVYRYGPYRAGCTTTVVTTAMGPLSCTGSETDLSADWPALTTNAPPAAGPGVNPWLLGAVYRADLGAFQVTYAGHPLYLFDPGPDSFFGANYLETVAPLPPWHTAWYLMSPDGQAAPGPANLETEAPQAGTTYTSTALAAEMLPNAVPGGAAITVYSFSGDRPWHSRCVWACAMEFIPVLTSGPPTVASGVNASDVGVIVRPDGSHQVTYDGQPLYIYSQEQPLVGAMGPITTGTAGNGNGIDAFGGTFSVVSP